MSKTGQHKPAPPAPDEPDRVPSPQGDAEARPAPEKADSRKRHEIGGPKGPEPTRYGDWERQGIVSDF